MSCVPHAAFRVFDSILSPLQGVLSKLGAAKELMKEVLAREAKKQQERAAAKEKDVYVSP